MDSSFNLFPIPITYCPNFISESERLVIFEKLCSLDCIDHDLVINGKSSFEFRDDLLTFLNLKKRIEDKLTNYTDTLKIRSVQITGSWYNIQQKGGYLRDHNHGSNAVSIALYINVEDRSSNLTFRNPNPLVSFFWSPLNVQKVNYSEHVINPKNGDMYIFPSWLNHGSSNINETENRTVISANASWNVTNIEDNHKINILYQ